MSCPPASTPFSTSGCRLARAAYRAAVRPAGPDPRMTTLRSSGTWFSILPQGERPPIPSPSGRRTAGLAPERLARVVQEAAPRAGGDPDREQVGGLAGGGAGG